MTRTKVILLVSFGLIFAAGVSVGMLLSPVAKASPTRQPLNEVLKLSSEQSEQMKKIWSGVRDLQSDRRAQRDEAVQALLTAEQRPKYDAIQQDYAKWMEQLPQERKKKFEQAMAMTRKILTPEQAVKYDEWVKQGERDRERGGPGGGSFWGGRHRHTAPSTKPATQATKPTTEPAAARGGQ